VSVYRLIAAEEAHHPISRLRRVLGVARPPSARSVADAALTETIRRVHAGSRATYGAPRVHAELADAHGIRCGRTRAARLMRTAGLAGCHRRRAPRTTRPDRAAAPAPDLVRRAFAAVLGGEGGVGADGRAAVRGAAEASFAGRGGTGGDGTTGGLPGGPGVSRIAGSTTKTESSFAAGLPGFPARL
jgi:hypothetical protein